MYRYTVAALCLLAGGAAHAAPALLDDEKLKQVLPGKTVHLDTPLGVSIPITYHANGLMSGKAGMLSYILGADNDRGRWWIEHGKLCQKWFKWLDAKPNCMRVHLDGPKVYWQADDGMNGTATITTGLAAGADAPPRGLGGPARALTLTGGHSASLATQNAPAEPRKTSDTPPAAPVVAAAASSLSGPGRTKQAEPVRTPEIDSVEASQQAHKCAATHAATVDTAHPTLVALTRQMLETEAAPSTDCFAVEPSLVSMARQGIEPR
jgi:hypothetical protein